MRSLILRPYQSTDLHPLIECWFNTWHAAFSPRRHPRPIDAWRRRFLDDYSGQAEVWLADATAGVAALMILFPDRGWLEQLFVDPRYQRRGLGRAFVSLAQLRCPQGLALDTPAENAIARDFYRRRGFTAREAAFDPLIGRVILRYVWPPR